MSVLMRPYSTHEAIVLILYGAAIVKIEFLLILVNVGTYVNTLKYSLAASVIMLRYSL